MSNIIVRIKNDTDEVFILFFLFTFSGISHQHIQPVGLKSVVVTRGALVGFVNSVNPRSTDPVFQVVQVLGQDGTEGEVNLFVGNPTTKGIIKIQFWTQSNGQNQFCFVTSGLHHHQVLAQPFLAPAANLDSFSSSDSSSFYPSFFLFNQVTFTFKYIDSDEERLYKEEQQQANRSDSTTQGIPKEIPPDSAFDNGICVAQGIDSSDIIVSPVLCPSSGTPRTPFFSPVLQSHPSSSESNDGMHPSQTSSPSTQTSSVTSSSPSSCIHVNPQTNSSLPQIPSNLLTITSSPIITSSPPPPPI